MRAFNFETLKAILRFAQDFASRLTTPANQLRACRGPRLKRREYGSTLKLALYLPPAWAAAAILASIFCVLESRLRASDELVTAFCTFIRNSGYSIA